MRMNRARARSTLIDCDLITSYYLYNTTPCPSFPRVQPRGGGGLPATRPSHLSISCIACWVAPRMPSLSSAGARMALPSPSRTRRGAHLLCNGQCRSCIPQTWRLSVDTRRQVITDKVCILPNPRDIRYQVQGAHSGTQRDVYKLCLVCTVRMDGTVTPHTVRSANT